MSSEEQQSQGIPPLFIIIAAAVFLYFMYESNKGTDKDKDGSYVVSSLYPEPADDLKPQVKRITEALTDKEHAGHLAAFYRRVAITIYEEANNSEQARFINQRSGENLSRSNPYVTYQPTIHAIAEQFVSGVCGKENIRLGVQEKEKLRDSFMAIAWACWMASDRRSADINYGEVSAAAWDSSKYSGLLLPEQQEYERMLAITNGVPAGIPGIDPESVALGFDDEKPLFHEDDEQERLRGPPEDQGNPITHGLIFNEAEYQTFAAQAPRFGDLGFGDTGKGKVRLLYQSLLKYDPEAFTEKQTTGDCTSHATRNACDVARAFEIDVLGQHESFQARGATEGIYGHRGHSGQGMSVYRAVQFVQEFGGVAIRKQYSTFDLSVYNAKVGIDWGKQGGVPNEVVSEVRQHQIAKASLVKTVEEARDAIYNGFPLVVGSDHSFSSQRDAEGVAVRTAQGWAHAMAWIAVDDTKRDGPRFLIANSWGKWNGGPKGEYDIPDGAFWITAKNAATMIAQKQAVAVGNFNGFDPLPLPNWGFEYLTRKPGTSDFDDAKMYDDKIEGIVEVSAAVSKLHVQDGGKDGVDSGKYTPETCPRRFSDCQHGWIQNGDGHWSPCPDCNGDGRHPRENGDRAPVPKGLIMSHERKDEECKSLSA